VESLSEPSAGTKAAPEREQRKVSQAPCSKSVLYGSITLGFDGMSLSNQRIDRPCLFMIGLM
jgi:hypothetical protein